MRKDSSSTCQIHLRRNWQVKCRNHRWIIRWLWVAVKWSFNHSIQKCWWSQTRNVHSSTILNSIMARTRFNCHPTIPVLSMTPIWTASQQSPQRLPVQNQKSISPTRQCARSRTESRSFPTPAITRIAQMISYSRDHVDRTRDMCPFKVSDLILSLSSVMLKSWEWNRCLPWALKLRLNMLQISSRCWNCSLEPHQVYREENPETSPDLFDAYDMSPDPPIPSLTTFTYPQSSLCSHPARSSDNHHPPGQHAFQSDPHSVGSLKNFFETQMIVQDGLPMSNVNLSTQATANSEPNADRSATSKEPVLLNEIQQRQKLMNQVLESLKKKNVHFGATDGKTYAVEAAIKIERLLHAVNVRIEFTEIVQIFFAHDFLFTDEFVFR